MPVNSTGATSSKLAARRGCRAYANPRADAPSHAYLIWPSSNGTSNTNGAAHDWGAKVKDSMANGGLMSVSRRTGGVRHPPEADIESIRDLLRGYGSPSGV